MAKGFTLIELMVVLSIIAIGALLAAPSYTQFVQREQHHKTLNQLKAVYRYSRSEAVKRDEAITLNFNSGVFTVLTADKEPLRQLNIPENNKRVHLTGIDSVVVSNTGNPSVSQQWLVSSLQAPYFKHCITILVSGQLKVTENACI